MPGVQVAAVEIKILSIERSRQGVYPYIPVHLQAAFLGTVGDERIDRYAAGDTGLAAIAMRAVTVTAATAKAMLDELVIDRHIEPQLRVRHQVAAQPVIEITTG